MINIQFSPEDKEYFDEVFSGVDEKISVIQSKKFEGSQDFMDIFIEISKLTSPFILEFIKRMLDKKKKITVKHGGVEITNLDEETAKEIIKEALKDSKKKKKK